METWKKQFFKITHYSSVKQEVLNSIPYKWYIDRNGKFTFWSQLSQGSFYSAEMVLLPTALVSRYDEKQFSVLIERKIMKIIYKVLFILYRSCKIQVLGYNRKV